MKKCLFVLMALVVLCLMGTGAMAKTWDLADAPVVDSFYQVEVADGDVITGTPSTSDYGVKLVVSADGTEITFDNISLDQALTISGYGYSVTVNLVGENKISDETLAMCCEYDTTIDGTGSLTLKGQSGIQVTGTLTIDGGTFLADTDVLGLSVGNLVINGGSFTAIGNELSAISVDGSITINAAGYEMIAGTDASNATQVANYSGEQYVTIGTTSGGNGGNTEGGNGNGGNTEGGNGNGGNTEGGNGNGGNTEGGNDNGGNTEGGNGNGGNTEGGNNGGNTENGNGNDVNVVIPTTSAPKTGDDSTIALWLCLMSISLIGIKVLTHKTKKQY